MSKSCNVCAVKRHPHKQISPMDNTCKHACTHVFLELRARMQYTRLVLILILYSATTQYDSL